MRLATKGTFPKSSKGHKRSVATTGGIVVCRSATNRFWYPLSSRHRTNGEFISPHAVSNMNASRPPQRFQRLHHAPAVVSGAPSPGVILNANAARGNMENRCISKYDENSLMYVVTSYGSGHRTGKVSPPPPRSMTGDHPTNPLEQTTTSKSGG